MLRHKVTINFNIDVQYPNLDDNFKFKKQFENSLKEWIESLCDSEPSFIPTLYDHKKGGAIEHQPNARVTATIIKDDAIILNSSWDELSDDF